MERHELPTKLDAPAVESESRLEELGVLRGTHDRDEGFVQSIVGQLEAALDAFFNQVRTQLVNRFCIGLEGAYDGSLLLCPSTSTHVSVVGTTSVEVQGSTPHSGEDEDPAAANPSTPVASKSPTTPTKTSRGRFKNVRR